MGFSHSFGYHLKPSAADLQRYPPIEYNNTVGYKYVAKHEGKFRVTYKNAKLGTYLYKDMAGMVAAWVHEQGGCNGKEEVDAFISGRSYYNVESKKRIDAKKALDDDMMTHVEELLPKLQGKLEKRKGSVVTMYSFYRFCQTQRNDKVFGQCSASFSFFKEHTAPLLVSKLLPDAHPHPDKINGYAFSDDADRPVSTRKRARVLPKPTMSSTSTTTETLVPPPPPPSVVVNASLLTAKIPDVSVYRAKVTNAIHKLERRPWSSSRHLEKLKDFKHIMSKCIHRFDDDVRSSNEFANMSTSVYNLKIATYAFEIDELLQRIGI